MNHRTRRVPASVGQTAPEFELASIDAAGIRRKMTLSAFQGRWLILVFYPRDFSFVCPTELTAFSARLRAFAQRNCELLGISVDSIETHARWFDTPVDAGGIGPLQFPLASDPHGTAARAYGVWSQEQQVSLRGLFVIDPLGVLQYSIVHNLSVGRSTDEVLRVLDALQTGGLCPASWSNADGTIDVKKALKPGRVIGHYRIVSQIGNGSFGTVFSARDLRLGRMVALKILKQSRADVHNDLFAEAQAAARLTHPNICQVYAIEEEDGLPLIAMEYLEGQTLDHLLRSGLTSGQKHRVAWQTAEAIAFAHSQGIVHGDLKPANILVTADGFAKILDFGLSEVRKSLTSATEDDRSSVRDIESGSSLAESDSDLEHFDPDQTVAATEDSGAGSALRGTPSYMSPEQTEGQRLTPASDVFAMGLILYELWSDKQAVSGLSVIETLMRIRLDDLADELARELPDPQAGLIRESLARDPERRPSMQVILQRLQHLK